MRNFNIKILRLATTSLKIEREITLIVHQFVRTMRQLKKRVIGIKAITKAMESKMMQMAIDILENTVVAITPTLKTQK